MSKPKTFQPYRELKAAFQRVLTVYHERKVKFAFSWDKEIALNHATLSIIYQQVSAAQTLGYETVVDVTDVSGLRFTFKEKVYVPAYASTHA